MQKKTRISAGCGDNSWRAIHVPHHAIRPNQVSQARDVQTIYSQLKAARLIYPNFLFI